MLFFILACTAMGFASRLPVVTVPVGFLFGLLLGFGFGSCLPARLVNILFGPERG
ncbi:MAG: hypothetical protein ACJ8F7_13280 [Gemmataceae bacterium]